MALACHMCVLLSSSLQGCFHIGQTLDGEKRVHRGFFFFFDESLNRTKTEGGVKEKYNALQPCPPSSSSWKHSDITSHTEKGLTVKSVSSSPNGGQPLHATLCHNIKGHALSTFKSPGRHNRSRSWGGMCICVQDEEGVGCAMVKWKLCGGNLSRLGFGAVHSHACIIYPFSLASMHPLSSKLPHYIGPPCSHSSTSKTRNWALASDNLCPWNKPRLRRFLVLSSASVVLSNIMSLPSNPFYSLVNNFYSLQLHLCILHWCLCVILVVVCLSGMGK